MALFIVFLHLAIYIYLLFSDSYFYDAAASLFLVSAYCLYRFYVAKKSKTGFYMDEFSFFILAGSCVALHQYLLAGACVLLGILYYYSLQNLRIVFNENSVMKMNFPKTTYKWEEFANILMKDNLLTLDFNSNKILQVELADENSIDESQFNAFAEQQLHFAKSGHKQLIN